MATSKTNLLGLTSRELGDFAEEIGESRYRGKQIFQWLYTKRLRDFRALSNLGKELRSTLEGVATIRGLQRKDELVSDLTGTTKFLFDLRDGLNIESVLIPPSSSFQDRHASQDEQQRLTLCVSTQVGCPLDCKFCATGTMGFSRNLDVGEIVDQVLLVKELTGKKITNVVFMGMGEPMMNYENVMKASEILVEGVGIAARRITVSTAGWVKGIKQMGEEKRRIKLAVSLHSAVDATRRQLMPVTRKHSLQELASAIDYYYHRTRQRVTYEHIFFEGINDTEMEVAQLIKFARRVPSKINVIPFHSIGFTKPTGFSATLLPSAKMPEIVDRLRNNRLTVFVRSSAGVDIDAACGQLAVESRVSRGRDLSGEDMSLQRATHHVRPNSMTS
jgi:23S rRNA (adenine2503-C2)-methyltransferase